MASARCQRKRGMPPFSCAIAFMRMLWGVRCCVILPPADTGRVAMSILMSCELYFSAAPLPSAFWSPITGRSFTTCAQSTCTTSPGPLESSSTLTIGISVVDCWRILRIAASSDGMGPLIDFSGVGARTAIAASALLNCLLAWGEPEGMLVVLNSTRPARPM